MTIFDVKMPKKMLDVMLFELLKVQIINNLLQYSLRSHYIMLIMM